MATGLAEPVEAIPRAGDGQYRALVEQSADAVLLTAAGGRILAANPAACRLFGYSEAEICHRGQAGLVAPDDPRLHALGAAHHRGGVVRGELDHLRRDGSRFPAEVTSVIFRERDGQPRAITIIRDLGARRQAAVAPHGGEAHFRSAFAHAAIGMALVAPDGRWLRVNRALCALLDYTEATLLATDFQALTHPDDLVADLRQVAALLAGTIEDYQLEKRYRRRDGRYFWALLSVSLVRDEHGVPLHFVAQIQDIDPTKRAEAALRTTPRRARRAGCASWIGPGRRSPASWRRRPSPGSPSRRSPRPSPISTWACTCARGIRTSSSIRAVGNTPSRAPVPPRRSACRSARPVGPSASWISGGSARRGSTRRIGSCWRRSRSRSG